MKKLLFIFLICFQFSFAQNESNKKADDFQVLDEVPVFPGCGVKPDNDSKKKCMSKAIEKHIEKKFRVQLDEDLDLPGGRYAIYVMFKLDKSGNIVDIDARAPHVKLKEEAIRIIKLLPKIKAGQVKGKPVIIPFSIPIYFTVEDSKEERKQKRKNKRKARELLKNNNN